MFNLSGIGLIIVWVILIAVLGMAFLMLYFLLKEWFGKKPWGSRFVDSVFLKVTVPKENSGSDQDAKKEEKELISIAEQFFATVAAGQQDGWFKLSDYISLEIAAVGKQIGFYVNVPKHLHELLEKQLHAQYPAALIEVEDPYDLFSDNAVTAAAELGLQKDYSFPIRTYKDMQSDPLNSLTNSLSKLGDDEGAAIQMLISPAGSGWQSKPRKFALEIQQGRNPTQVTAANSEKMVSGILSGLGGIFDSLFNTQGQKKHEGKIDSTGYKNPIHLTPMQQEIVKKFEEKASKTGFRFNLRVISSSPDPARADANLKNILASFMQYTMPPFNGFKIRATKAGRIVTDYIFRIYRSSSQVLNTEELASVWHLPTRFSETPNISWLSSKKAAPPPNLPREGLLLGENVYRGVTTPIHMKREDRRRHSYIVGRTGTGKTELMKNMVIQDVQNGEGLCIIDPHGDFVSDVLQFIPKERADDVILFEPFDLDRPFGLNMLEVKSDEQKDFVIQEMIAIFYKLFPPEMIGPMFEHNMRNVMLTLMEDKQYPGTIADIPRMFTDPAFQKYKVAKVKDPIVRSFWEKEMAKTSDFHKSEMLGYLISKVGRFVENEMIRNIIGQPTSSFDFRKIMDEGKILLINLSKGKTGEVNAKLLGLIIVAKLQMAAMSRADQPEEKRRDFYLYVDEFQNFVTDSFATILSEARKYRLNLVLAHQFLSQLVIEKEGTSATDTRMRDAVFGNAGTIISFRIGVEDAGTIAKEFAPVFSEYDLVNVERFHAFVKLMVNGTASRPFDMHTFAKPAVGHVENAAIIRNLSRLKHGRTKGEVSKEIYERTQLGNLNSGVAQTERTA